MKKTPVVEDSDKIKRLTDQNFEHQIKSGITLVDFWATWCMPCKIMAPILNDLSEVLTGNASVGKLDVDKNKAASAKYGVRSIPTLILFKNGKEINRFVGVKTKDFLLKEIQKVQ
ncbi:MAG: thioredoxin [Bacteroidetes bacterium]|nr:thioredoxin [Bacteroidota bacterium]